jgi:hypothetical protein
VEEARPDPLGVVREVGECRVALAGGFSLHADTQVHRNDREGLARLARYGARGPIAESRLSLREDGKYAYQTKRGAVLVLTAEQLVKRLVWLIPPKGLHLTNFHGVFASHAKARAEVLPKFAAARPEQTAAPLAHAKEPARLHQPRRPRIDWATLHARTWGVDVWRCPCGGRRKVLAVVTDRRTAEQMLRNLGRWQLPPPMPAAHSPPQLALAI